jgi:hypothetical protein
MVPYGVAVDGSGNVYIADFTDNERVLKETLSAGGYTRALSQTLSATAWLLPKGSRWTAAATSILPIPPIPGVEGRLRRSAEPDLRRDGYRLDQQR